VAQRRQCRRSGARQSQQLLATATALKRRRQRIGNDGQRQCLLDRDASDSKDVRRSSTLPIATTCGASPQATGSC
jgi:hypothetical protein